MQPTEHLSIEELERAKEYIDWNWNKSPWDKVVRRLRGLFTRGDPSRGRSPVTPPGCS